MRSQRWGDTKGAEGLISFIGFLAFLMTDAVLKAACSLHGVSRLSETTCLTWEHRRWHRLPRSVGFGGSFQRGRVHADGEISNLHFAINFAKCYKLREHGL